jgi:hypothetical protein
MRKKGNAYRNWCENLKERNYFEYLTVWKHNIKTHFKEIGCDYVDFAQGKLAGSPNTTMNLQSP